MDVARIFRHAFLCSILLFSVGANGAEDPEVVKKIGALDWQVGPKSENVAAKATLNIDANLAFIDEANSKKFLQLTDNIPEDGNFILLSSKDNWWATFQFSPMGYVKDNESIDADKLLEELKSRDAEANETRKKLGIPELITDSWYVRPHYDSGSNSLEWGLKLLSNDGVVLNYTIRLLGRTGVMNVTLVSSPETLDADVRSFKQALRGFEFNSGERYAEFKPGDRVAEYGLAALIVGGAAAVATKKGFWALIAGFLAAAWKFIVVALVGAMSWIRSLFKRKT